MASNEVKEVGFLHIVTTQIMNYDTKDEEDAK